jgi:hypothetical protein
MLCFEPASVCHIMRSLSCEEKRLLSIYRRPEGNLERVGGVDAGMVSQSVL